MAQGTPGPGGQGRREEEAAAGLALLSRGPPSSLLPARACGLHEGGLHPFHLSGVLPSGLAFSQRLSRQHCSSFLELLMKELLL